MCSLIKDVILRDNLQKEDANEKRRLVNYDLLLYKCQTYTGGEIFHKTWLSKRGLSQIRRLLRAVLSPGVLLPWAFLY